ncbi:unnamed protein product [Caenorhabditis sp. 36 PRJEB53466]|nr:unnamed protein product [Caenorhabditis sp. 36 PRJEB53466]
MWPLWFVIGLLLSGNVLGELDPEKNLTQALLVGYNPKIRPVKVETTVTQVTVFLNIAHVEKVDENEQTALVHGHLWASWTDEYLQWKRGSNNITKIQLQAFRIWQPALALYNSARGNTWHLYMNGLPATVYYTGKVWASGTFSFHVTCQFDFTDWPFDRQSCPIVLADWVYGLAQVNLSDPNTISEYAKPTIRLSYDPTDKTNKRHVGGWEVEDAWKKHCYWGPKGCKSEQPEGEAEWYWSLLEFGIILKRHLPYLGATILLPYFLTTLIILAAFWIDTFSVNVAVIIFNILLQGIYGWNMIQKMPPGSGKTPKIIQLYTLNLVLSSFSLVISVFSKFLEESLPKEFELNFGIDITAIPKQLGVDRFFEPKGLSFDPQALLNPEEPESLESMLEMGGASASTSIGIENVLETDDIGVSREGPSEDTMALISLPTNEEPPFEMNEDDVASGFSKIPDQEEEDEEEEKKKKKKPTETKLQLQLHLIKRLIFVLVVLVYIVAALLCIYL